MRVAIFTCEDAAKWKGYTERLWGSITDEPLTAFRCYEGEFPNPATCRERFDAIVVGGSHYSAYEDLPWIRQLEELLPQYVAAGVRVVGCCFGHQILAKALGGSVGKNPSGRFVLGVEDVAVDLAAARACGLQLPDAAAAGPSSAEAEGGHSVTGSTGASYETAGAGASVDAGDGGGGSGSARAAAAAAAAATGAGPSGSQPAGSSGLRQQQLRLRMLESHGDQVLTLPPGATLLASSGTAPHEMWALGDRCLAFQFHPELTTDLLYDKIWTALSASGRLSPEEATKAEAQLKAGQAGVDSGVFWKALQAYLSAPPPEPLRGGAGTASASGSAAAGAADAAAAAAQGGLQAAAEVRQAMQQRAAHAAEEVLGHVRQAAAAGMAAGTANAELLTSLNREAAAAYGSAVAAAQGATEKVVAAVATQQEPLKAALASLGALEAQLDRLAAVVGSLEQESAALEEEAAARSQVAGAEARTQGPG